MNVCWITRFPLSERDGKLYSEHAAIRLRIAIPVTELRALGHRVSVLQIGENLRLPDFAAVEANKLAVFDQLYPFGHEQLDVAGAPLLDMIGRCARAGIKTIADIHDDHFSLPGRMEYFRRLVQLADTTVVNTAGMQHVVAEHTSRPIAVIGDPYEGPHGEVSFMPAVRQGGWWRRLFARSSAPRLRLAWFGHQSNLAALYALMPELAKLGKRVPIGISIVTARNSGVEEWCEIFNHHHGRRCRAVFVPWSLESSWSVLRDCDLCVIPVDVATRAKSVKSANRLVEALRAGRFVVASPLPAYREFSESALVGEDIAQGIAWAVDHPAEVAARVRAGQLMVEQYYSPAAIAQQWLQTLASLAA
jgi:hypothetical protein